MPSLIDYRATIIANNVLAHTIRKQQLSVKWQRVCNANPELSGIVESFHRQDGSYSLSRAEVFACDDTFEKVIKAMWWGYPYGMRANFDEVVQNFRLMTEILRPYQDRVLDEQNFIELYNRLNQIPHIGPATISKLLYFFNIFQGQTRCVIVDSRVRSTMAAFDDYQPVRNRLPALWYLEHARQLNEIGIAGATPEQIEYFLFRYSFSGRTNNDQDTNAIPVVSLEVYNNPNHKNHGRTFRIINNYLTLPHNVNHVYVELHGNRVVANIGAYRGRGNTLGGASTIKPLIENNNWQPGELLSCQFVCENHIHVYKIV